MTLRTLFDWWLERLLEWVPPSLHRRIGSSRDALVLEWQAQGLRVAARQGGRLQEFAVLAPDELETRRAGVERFVAGLSRRPREVEIRIPPARFLQREIDLPLAAADSLQEAVGFQLERIAPFRAEDAVFQCGLLSRDPAAKRLQAWVRVAPRALTAQAESLLQGMRLLPLSGPRTAPGAESAMVVSFATGQGALLRGWVLPVLAVVLAGVALNLHLSHRERQLALLEEALFEQRRAGAAAVEVADALERIQSEARALQERRGAQPLLVAVLDDLSSRLDDQTWLQRFEAREGEVRLYGVSAAASPLIARLEDSPLLDGVRFEAAVNRDPASGGDRFSIAARLTGVPEREGTP
jgi:general secretion pathway protein L